MIAPFVELAGKLRGLGPQYSHLDGIAEGQNERVDAALDGVRFPQDGRPYWLYGLAVFALLWVVFTSMHMIGPQERGVITREAAIDVSGNSDLFADVDATQATSQTRRSSRSGRTR